MCTDPSQSKAPKRRDTGRSPKRYAAVIVDLFDTVVRFCYSRLPRIETDGRIVYTTSPVVFECFWPRVRSVPFGQFHTVFRRTYRRFEAMKRARQVEYPNRLRFLMLLEELGLRLPACEAEQLAESMSQAHMEVLMRGVVFPNAHKETLRYLSRRYPLGLLTNFDHSPTVRRLLGELGIERFFDAVTISADHGMRKPREELFLKTASMLGAHVEETVFVGDNYAEDVVGAKRSGMDAVWVALGRKVAAGASSTGEAADYVVDSFPEVTSIL